MTLPINPDCREGKHRACNGDAWHPIRDEATECVCNCHPPHCAHLSSTGGRCDGCGERSTWRIDLNDDNTVDEVVMQGAAVHLEDMGGVYMLIVDNGEQHIHLTIPSPRFARRGGRAFVYEQYDPRLPWGHHDGTAKETT